MGIIDRLSLGCYAFFMDKKIYFLVRKNSNSEKRLFYVENEILAEICNRFFNKNCRFSYEVQKLSLSELELLKIQFSSVKKINSFDDFITLQIHTETQEPRKQTKNSTFVKLNNFWYKLDSAFPLENAVLYDYSGKPIKANASSLEKKQAENWSKLDWSNTKVLGKYETGLLSPSGEFYGCDLKFMEQCANFVLNMSLKQLSKLGFVQINAVNHQHKKELIAYPVLLYQGLSNLTNAQVRFLRQKNVLYYKEYFVESTNLTFDLTR